MALYDKGDLESQSRSDTTNGALDSATDFFYVIYACLLACIGGIIAAAMITFAILLCSEVLLYGFEVASYHSGLQIEFSKHMLRDYGFCMHDGLTCFPIHTGYAIRTAFFKLTNNFMAKH